MFSISAAMAQAQKFVEVTGVGLASAKPDIALVSISIGVDAETAKAARISLAEKIGQATAELKEFGVAPEDFQLGASTMSYVYDCRSCAERGTPGFNATRTVSVTVRDLNAIDEVISTLVTGQSDYLQEVRTRFSDPDKLYAQAQLNSLENARKKAEVIAGTYGMKLGQLISFKEEKPNLFPLEKRDVHWTTTSNGHELTITGSSVVRFGLEQE